MDKTVVELFAGVGGFRCGLNNVIFKDGEVIEENIWNFLWANQWEPSTKSQAAFDCYVERFGISKNHVNKDIATIDKNDIPNHTLLVGGFPCQDYSVARTISNEKGIEGKKGVLWWQIAEVLEAKLPPFVLLENVDRLLRSPASQRGRDFGVMLRTLYNLGYSVEWRVINAAEYGFHQKRRRVFIFAYHNSTNYFKKMNKINNKSLLLEQGLFAKSFPIKKEILETNKTKIDKNSFDDLVDISDNFNFHFFNSGIMENGNICSLKVKYDCNKVTPLKDILEKNPVDDKYFITGEKLEKWKYLKGSKKIERKRPNGETYCYSEGSIPFPENLDIPARTMLTSESSVNRSSHEVEDIHSGNLRIITPIEAERINMFPDNWTNINQPSVTERRRYFLMGNALVVGIIKRLGHFLENIVENEN